MTNDLAAWRDCTCAVTTLNWLITGSTKMLEGSVLEVLTLNMTIFLFSGGMYVLLSNLFIMFKCFTLCLWMQGWKVFGLFPWEIKRIITYVTTLSKVRESPGSYFWKLLFLIYCFHVATYTSRTMLKFYNVFKFWWFLFSFQIGQIPTFQI